MKLRYSIPLMFAASFTLLACFKPQTLAQKMEPTEKATQTQNYYLNSNPFNYFFALNSEQDVIYNPKDSKQNLAFAASQSRPSLSISDQIVNELIYNVLFNRATYSQLADPWVSIVKKTSTNHLTSMLNTVELVQNTALKRYNCSIRGAYDGDYTTAYTFTVKNSHSYRRMLCKGNHKEISLEVVSRRIGDNESQVMVLMRNDYIEGVPNEELTHDSLKFEFFDTISSSFDDSWHKMGLGFRETESGYEWTNKTINHGQLHYVEVKPYPGSNHQERIKKFKQHL